MTRFVFNTHFSHYFYKTFPQWIIIPPLPVCHRFSHFCLFLHFDCFQQGRQSGFTCKWPQSEMKMRRLSFSYAPSGTLRCSSSPLRTNQPKVRERALWEDKGKFFTLLWIVWTLNEWMNESLMAPVQTQSSKQCASISIIFMYYSINWKIHIYMHSCQILDSWLSVSLMSLRCTQAIT